MLIFFPNFFHLTQINLDWGGRAARRRRTQPKGVRHRGVRALPLSLSPPGRRVAAPLCGSGERVEPQRLTDTAGRSRARRAGRGDEQQRFGLQTKEDRGAAPGRARRRPPSSPCGQRRRAAEVRAAAKRGWQSSAGPRSPAMQHATPTCRLHLVRVAFAGLVPCPCASFVPCSCRTYLVNV